MYNISLTKAFNMLHASIAVSIGCFQYVIVDHTSFVDCLIPVIKFCTLATDFVLLFGINCTEIDQSQSSITYMYIINCESLVFTTLIKCSSYWASTLTRNINKCCVLKILLCVSLRVCTDVDVITLHRV